MDSSIIPFKRTVNQTGGSLMIVIPPELVSHLELEQGVEVHIAGDKAKHGPFIAIWNPEQQKKKKAKE